MKRRLLIVKTGSTMEELASRRGDYEDWIAQSMGVTDIQVVDVQQGEELPDPTVAGSVVVTGSSALVTDREPWSVRAGHWLAEVTRRGTPILAICYGHQLLADALGGEVKLNSRGRQMGVVDVSLTDEGRADPLLGVLPSPFAIGHSHRQHVLQLPEGATLLAYNANDPHAAFRLGERAWGVQFHPEWNHDVMRFYLEARRTILRDEGFDPDALLSAVTPSPHGEALLARFAEVSG